VYVFFLLYVFCVFVFFVFVLYVLYVLYVLFVCYVLFVLFLWYVLFVLYVCDVLHPIPAIAYTIYGEVSAVVSEYEGDVVVGQFGAQLDADPGGVSSGRVAHEA
jgi:hypothetical protein